MAVLPCPRCGAECPPASSPAGLCPACLLAAALADDPAPDNSSDDSKTLPEGAEIGAFRILGLLGRGGMGTVYRALDTRLDRTTALKVLPPQFADDDAFAKRFELEARVIAKLEHPNIVPIYETGIDGGIPWMSMRLMAGGTLGALLEKRRLSSVESVRLLRGIADALDYAHTRGVLHRDIKPSNILLDDADRACVGDFGLAQLLEADNRVTHTGTLVGTPHYMSPERALGEPVDHRADIYSLGIVAYEMFVGSLPFVADSPVTVLLKHVSQPLPSPGDAQLSPPLKEAIEKATAKKPADRWSSAGAFVSALETAVVAVPPIEVQAAKRRIHQIFDVRQARPALATVIVTAVAGLAWWIATNTTAPSAIPDPPRVDQPVGVEQQQQPAAIPETPSSAAMPQPEQPAPRVRPSPTTSPPPPPTSSAPPPPVALPAPAASPTLPPPPTGPPQVEDDRSTPSDNAPPPDVADAAVSDDASAVGSTQTVEPPPPTIPAEVDNVPSDAGEVVTTPQRTRTVNPDYPAAAHTAQVEGDVIFEAVVATDGTIAELTVVQSVHPLLDEAARAAVMQYEYTPAMRNGVPLAVTVRIVVSFRLQ